MPRDWWKSCPGNCPWAFKGRVGLWHNSTLQGSVRIVGCALIALRNDNLEWEPYDVSDVAKGLFPFNPENIAKHQVPTETLTMLAKTWTRMYAWFLEEPLVFNPPVPVPIKKGAQKIQSMDEDTWYVVWEKFQTAQKHGTDGPEHSMPKLRSLSGTLTVLGMGFKDAFQLLEGNSSILLKSYKPQTKQVVST